MIEKYSNTDFYLHYGKLYKETWNEHCIHFHVKTTLTK